MSGLMAGKRGLIMGLANDRSLAWGIASAVREAYPTLERFEVTVRKPNPPVGGPCDRAEVTLALGPA